MLPHSILPITISGGIGSCKLSSDPRYLLLRAARAPANNKPAALTSASTIVGSSGESTHPDCAKSGSVAANINGNPKIISVFFRFIFSSNLCSPFCSLVPCLLYGLFTACAPYGLSRLATRGVATGLAAPTNSVMLVPLPP
jgi:hypothetical protein